MASVTSEKKKCTHCHSSLSNGHSGSYAKESPTKHALTLEYSLDREAVISCLEEPRKKVQINGNCKSKENRIPFDKKQICDSEDSNNVRARPRPSCITVLEVSQVQNSKKSAQKHFNDKDQRVNKGLRCQLCPESDTVGQTELTQVERTSNCGLNGVTAGITKNPKHIFSGKMEILADGEGGVKQQVSPIKLGEITADVTIPGNERTWKRHSAKQDVMIPQVSTQEKSPRYFLPVCPFHDGSNGGETLEAVLYCAVCVETVCYKCAFQKHKDHSVSPIQAAAENIRVNLAERKRRIESVISQMRTKRKNIETSNDELRQRIHTQFEQVILRLRKKEEEVISEVNKVKAKKINFIHGIQNQQETAWGQIDAVLKTSDDVKMLEEYNGLTIVDFKHPDSKANCDRSTINSEENLIFKESPRVALDLNVVQDEIEKIRLECSEVDSSIASSETIVSNGITPRQSKKRFSFKLDPTTAHTALKVSTNYSSVEYIGAERNGFVMRHHPNGVVSVTNGTNPYSTKYQGIAAVNGVNGRLKRTQFATVLGNSSITQGKQYWEISVNRSMEYRLGVAYKHMQGTKTLADEHNCWALCLTYPDRFSAIHKHHREYIFVPTHAATNAAKVIRIGVFLDYERGVLSFYNASTAAEKRHLYTFRTFFNRPVWPLLSLRQGKLQVLTGLPVPRNLVWKSR
ncbi:uncharacterized protein LOC143463326 isoform X2 [Clavelina lepadiformis]|uniref:uncharacterized protein LOC143463326 isoform X2 n=1 Tax=Clavelina lepadiformis TaxID=159417 RepID=UPI004041F368